MKIREKIDDALAWLLWLLCYMVAILPHCVRFKVLSPLVAFVLRSVIHYRRAVIVRQLKASFPDYDEAKIEGIAHRYYDHLAEMIICTLSMAKMGGKARRKIMEFDLPENFHEVVDNRNVVYLTSHYGFWEYALNIYLQTPEHYLVGAYHPLKNSVMDKLFIRLRKVDTVVLVPSKGLMRYFFNNAKSEKPALLGLGLVSDQNCPPTRGCCWHRFLNHDSLFFDGGEQLALKFGMPVYYIEMERIKAGHYRLHLVQLYDGVEEVKPHEITEKYIRLLEQTIIAKPEYWLWSHNRWKHKPDAEAKFYDNYK